MKCSVCKVLLKILKYLVPAVLGFCAGGCANNGTIRNYWSIVGYSQPFTTNVVNSVSK